MSNKPRSNLAVRLITVAVAAPLLLGLLFFGPAWGWALLIILSAGLAGRELLGMTHPDDQVARAVGALFTMAMAAGVYFGVKQPLVLVTSVLTLPILSALVPLWRLGQIPSAALRIAGGVTAPLYVGAPLATLALLRRDLDAGAGFVFFTLTIAWMGDTGGYTFGRLFGKTKLYEAVSPKKTREGFLGSLVFATAATCLASFTYLPSVPVAHAAALGVLGGALGQAGDLVESLFKRSTGIKDSGSLLPGHGGMLDRIDALMVVSPLVYLYTQWAL